MRTRYRRYLRSAAWQRRRHAVLIRDGYRCTVCGARRPLQVHHRTYRRIYRELVDDLVTLCRPCHQAHHAEGRSARRQVAGVLVFLVSATVALWLLF